MFHEIYDRGGGKKSEETIEKMKKSQKGENNNFYGKKHSEETKRIISKKHTNTYHTEFTKNKMSVDRFGKNNNFYGRNHSEESKKLMSESNKGKKQEMTQIERCSTKIKIDNVIYFSIREASRILKIDRKTIGIRLKDDKYENYEILISRSERE